MTLLNAAYGVLSDPLKRRQYDQLLAEAARRAAEPPVYRMRAAPRHPAQPWLLWIGITAVLVVIAFSGTLYTLRSSIPAFSLALFSSPTRIPVVVIQTRGPNTPTREPSQAPSATPTPTATAPPPAATSLPSTPTLTPAPSPLPVVNTPTRTAYPLPVPSSSQNIRIVRTEFPNGPAGAGDIVVSSLDGSVKTNLTRSAGLSELAPSWSPDGRRIVYSELNSGDLFVVDIDGEPVTRLTSDPQMRAANPVWAPQGSLIAYESVRRDTVPSSSAQASRVFVIDSVTRQKRQIGDFPCRDLTWSPDARWLACQVPGGTGATLYIIAIDNPSQQYFFSTPHIRRLAWTADARRLAYEAFVRDTNGDGHIDEQDTPDIDVITLQPLDLQRLSGSLTVVSPRGAFPGPAIDGEYFPPVTSTVRQ